MYTRLILLAFLHMKCPQNGKNKKSKKYKKVKAKLNKTAKQIKRKSEL